MPARRPFPPPGTLLEPDPESGVVPISMFDDADLAWSERSGQEHPRFTGGLCIVYIRNSERPHVRGQLGARVNDKLGAVLVLDSATQRIGWVYSDEVRPA